MLWISLKRHLRFEGQRLCHFISVNWDVTAHSEPCRLFLPVASRMETWFIQGWLSLMANERRRKKKPPQNEKTKPGQESTVEVVIVLALLVPP